MGESAWSSLPGIESSLTLRSAVQYALSLSMNTGFDLSLVYEYVMFSRSAIASDDSSHVAILRPLRWACLEPGIRMMICITIAASASKGINANLNCSFLVI